MLARTVVALILAVAVFAAFEVTKHSQASRANVALARDTKVTAAAQSKSTTEVEITFDGLMLFQKRNNYYDVGIMPAPRHDFVIFKNRVPAYPLDTMRGTTLRDVPMRWTLDVIDSRGGVKSPDIKPIGPENCNRFANTSVVQDPFHAIDFCWIMDLENDFHGGRELNFRITQHLMPIIQLGNGLLYAKYKFPQIKRQGPNHTVVDYGFVAETIGLKVELNEGERLVLRGQNGHEIFYLSNKDDHASLFNAPPCHRRVPNASATFTHFHYFYDLFDNVNPGEDYDLVTMITGALHPLNEGHPTPCDPRDRSKTFGTMESRTYDNQACGSAFLGVSKGTLQ